MGSIYINETAFITYNPWFDLALQSRVRKELASNSFKYRIRDEMNEQFPALWRHHMLSDPEWTRLKEKLNDHTNVSAAKLNSIADNNMSRMQSAVDSCVGRLNSVVDMKSRELVNSDQFEPLKSSIFNAALNRYQTLEDSLRVKNTQADEARNKRLDETEKELDKVQNRQALTFLGGSIFGAGMAILGLSMGKK
jgi:hypothetical protein